MLKLMYLCRIRVGKCFISSAADIVSVYGQYVVHTAYTVSVVSGKKLPERQDQELSVLKKCTAVMLTGLNWCRTGYITCTSCYIILVFMYCMSHTLIAMFAIVALFSELHNELEETIEY